MTFSEALEAVKSGKKIQREGWNGKGMWLIYIPADCWVTNITSEVSGLRTIPWLAMRTVDAALVPWLASQTDILADDWRIVE